MRSTGSLLVRALVVGGLTAAAWLLGSAVASAAPTDHSDEVANAHDVVKTALATFHQHRDDALSALAPVRESWITSVTDQVVAGTAHTLTGTAEQPVITQNSQPLLPVTQQAAEDENSEPPRDSYSGGSFSGTSKSGSTSNSMPEPMVAAKFEAKAAVKRAELAAKEAAAVEAKPAAEPVTSTLVPQRTFYAVTPSAPVSIEDVDVESYTELDWEVPTPTAPSPGPQPVSAPAAPTVSSGGHDNSGGTRGVLAVTTAQSSLHPATTWSVERRDDGRTPGSEQGLPSSSPD